MKRLFFVGLFLWVTILSTERLAAKVKLPAFFTDHMVFQQQTNAAIWGWAVEGKTITVQTSWNKKTYKTITDQKGKWKVMVATPAFGGPYEITISDGEPLVLKDILIGEVWLCSGQSNMEMPLAGWGKINNFQEEINAANFPKIRLLQVLHQASKLPAEDVQVTNNGWTSCDPTTVANFSSTAYFFAREIFQKTGVPIGLIHSSWGGTVAEAWTSAETLQKSQDFREEVNAIQKSGLTEIGLSEPEKLEKWQKAVQQSDKGNIEGWTAKSFDDSNWKNIHMPSLWEKTVLPDFDGMVYVRKKITIPASWEGKEVKLNLGGLDDQDITYFDGEKIGETLTSNTNRSYTIAADKVKAGDHTIVIRIFDTGSAGGSPSDDKFWNMAVGQEVINIAGDWKYQVAFNLRAIGPSPQLNLNVNKPTILYNAMISPFIQYAIKGVIWYQGESNAARANQYRTLFPSLISDWRGKFNIGNFPFYFVQLANYMAPEKEPIASNWAELRDAQKGALKLPNTGMAVTIDIGDEKDIHPKNKQEVGRRLALIALAKTYGQHVAFSGPAFREMKIDKNQATLSFDAAQSGLVAKNGTLKGFAIAGADQHFYWAKGVIVGQKVIISSSEVPNPVAVRYAWANNPEANLYNGDGLPASPFKTDQWTDSTAKK